MLTLIESMLDVPLMTSAVSRGDSLVLGERTPRPARRRLSAERERTELSFDDYHTLVNADPTVRPAADRARVTRTHAQETTTRATDVEIFSQCVETFTAYKVSGEGGPLRGAGLAGWVDCALRTDGRFRCGRRFRPSSTARWQPRRSSTW